MKSENEIREKKSKAFFNFYIGSVLCCLVLFLTACNNRTTGEEVPFSYVVSGFSVKHNCLFVNREPTVPIVFRNQDDVNMWNECFHKTPDIEFTKESLVAIWIRAGGCEFRGSQITRILRDDTNKSVTFRVMIDVVGDCAELHQGIIWATIPALPDNYSVIAEFDK